MRRRSRSYWPLPPEILEARELLANVPVHLLQAARNAAPFRDSVVPGTSDETVSVEFHYVDRFARLRSETGLFLVDDASGRIGKLMPGDRGYTQAALARRQVLFRRTQGPGSVANVELSGGSVFGLYLVQNGTSAQATAAKSRHRPTVFVSFPKANSDHFTHVRKLSPDLVAWEDQTGGGDRDYNDLFVQIDFGPIQGGPTQPSGGTGVPTPVVPIPVVPIPVVPTPVIPTPVVPTPVGQDQPPTVTINSPSSGTVTNQNLVVSGRVSGDSSVSTLQASVFKSGETSGTPVVVPFDPATGAFSFTTALKLDGSADGVEVVRFVATDSAGTMSSPVSLPFTLDTQPPTIANLSPNSGATSRNNPTISGDVSDETSSVAGLKEQVDHGPFSNLAFEASGAFHLTTSLPLDGSADGAHVIRLVATDAAGNTSPTTSYTFTLDTQPPTISNLSPNSGATSRSNPTISGHVADSVSSVVGLQEQVDNGAFANLAFDASGAFHLTTSLPLDGSANGVHVVRFVATDAAGNTSPPTSYTFTLDTSPPDPSTVAPALDQTTFTSMLDATSFLYSGSAPIQTGVAPGTIVLDRAAVVRGTVLDRSSKPVSGVTVTVLDHPEFGQTKTRDDGMFDLAVNGGGLLTFVFNKVGYLTVQSQTDVADQDYTVLSEVALTPLDEHVTDVDLSSPAPIQVAQGSVETDSDGTRQATLLFPQGETATMTLPDGSTQPLTNLNVRETEYTVGDTGPMAMPGTLPPSSGYTYCVELSVDQAQQAGATQVNFSQAIPFYVQNFLNFPVGTAVPAGYYDRSKGLWVPSENGRVIKVLSITDGEADLDTDGDGKADDATTLATLGITEAERTKLASLYQPGATLWRVPITHFTPWDYNWPFGPPPGATGPTDDPDDLTDGEQNDPNLQCPASVISIENQSLGESIPVVGTPFSLNYQSDRVAGDVAARTISIPLTQPTLPPDLKRVELTIDVAGREFNQIFEPAPSLSTTFTWDGMDAYGRTVQGTEAVAVRIGYVYNAVYQSPEVFGVSPGESIESFGLPSGVPIESNRARGEVTLFQNLITKIGIDDSSATGLGGWTLNVQNSYDPNSQVLNLGDGENRHVDNLLKNVLTRIAGNDNKFSGDGGPAIDANLSRADNVAVGPDGSLYIVDSGDARIRRISPDGIITTVAGNGQEGFSGEGGLATQAEIIPEGGIAVGSDGSIYISVEDPASGSRRAPYSLIRRVGPDGIITTIAGSEQIGFSGDGGPATQASFSNLDSFGDSEGVPSLAIGPDGSLYIADYDNYRVRRVGPDGIITTVAGNGQGGISGEGGPATQASIDQPYSIAVGPDGSLYVDPLFPGIVNRIGPDGVITIFAGIGGDGFGGDGGLATQADIGSANQLATGSDGSLYIVGRSYGVVRKVSSDGIITTVAGYDPDPYYGIGDISAFGVATGPNGSLYIATYGYGTTAYDGIVLRLGTSLPDFGLVSTTIPSEDGTELYDFDPTGRHLDTRDALTGAVVYSFGYDSAGRLNSVTDADGNVTTIQHDAAGDPTAIVSPDGQVTTLTVNGDGYLTTVKDPAGETTTLGYAPGGLLTSFTDPLGHESVRSYDDSGRLIKDQDATGAFTTLTRQELGGGSYKVTTTDAVDGTRQYLVENLPDGSVRRTAIDGRGFATVTLIGTNGSETTTLPDGTVTTVIYGPDPRFGMLAPVVTSQTVVTPSGLTSSTYDSRTATFAMPGDSTTALETQTDTVDVNGQTFTSVFNAAAGTITSTSAEGRTSVTTVDAKGRTVMVQSPGVDATKYTYDSRGRLSTITQGNRTVNYTYDPYGNLATITDPLNQTTKLAYDADDRLTRQTQPDGSVITFAYDAAGNMVGLTPPGESETTFTYDAHNELTSTTPPATGADNDTTKYVYNLAHQLVTESLPGGADISYAYCECGRLTSITAPWGVYTYTYSATTGVLSTLDSPGGFTLAFGYDGALGTSETLSGPVSGQVNWTYDANFRVTSETVNGANPVTFAYDEDGLLIQAGDLTLTRDAASGRVTGTTLGTVTDSTSYDEFGDPSTYQAQIGQTAALQDTYTRDVLGRITEQVETVGGVTTTTDYVYDLIGQLTTVKENGVLVQSYAYDANGNRLKLTTPTGTVSGTYNAQDQLLTYGTKSYTYSPDGSLSSVTDSATGQTTHYTYDGFGNLTRVDLPDGRVITYLIDGENRRVGDEINGVLTEGLLYDGQLTLVAKLDASGNVAERFVYATGGNVPAYMIKNEVTYRLVTDELGSVRLVVDVATGAIAQRLDYDVFGRVILDTNPGFQPFGFTGGLYDSGTGLVRFGARDYDPEIGRWMAKDSVGFQGGSNIYIYSFNCPVEFTDPNGHSSVPVTGVDRQFIHNLTGGLLSGIAEDATVLAAEALFPEVRAVAVADSIYENIYKPYEMAHDLNDAFDSAKPYWQTDVDSLPDDNDIKFWLQSPEQQDYIDPNDRVIPYVEPAGHYQFGDGENVPYWRDRNGKICYSPPD